MKTRTFAYLLVPLALPARAYGQSACGQLGVNCSHPATSPAVLPPSSPFYNYHPTGTGNNNRSNNPTAPTADDIAEQQAFDLNKQGGVEYSAARDAFKSGDYANALVHFQRALEFYRQASQTEPDARGYLTNIAMTRGVIAATQGEIAWKNNDGAAALADFKQANALYSDKGWRENADAVQKWLIQQQEGKIRQEDTANALSKIADTASKAQSGISQGSALEFKTDTDAFGSTKSNPQLETASPPQPVELHGAVDQLTSAEKSGVAANGKGVSEESSKVQSNCAIDNVACAKPRPIPIDKVVGQSPGASALVAHIPDAAKSDEEIRQNIAYYEKLDGKKLDAQARLNDVQRRIDSGAGDAEALKYQQSKLAADLKQYEADEAGTRAQIKKRLVTIHVAWTEDPPPAAGAKENP